MLSLTRLRLLREVSVRGSLAAAAAALGNDPSSVSHQLKALESEVGAPLLERVGRGVRLTEQAKILVAHTERVLGELEAAEAEIAAAGRKVVGTVRIAAFQTALHTIVPGALAALARDCPELRVETSHIPVEDGVPALLARDFDLVLLEDYPARPGVRTEGVQVEHLGDDELCLITSQETSAGIDLGRCADHVWAMEAPGAPARQWSLAECRRAGFEPAVEFESSDVLLLVRLVSLGLASALVPDLALRAARGSTGAPAPRRTPLPGSPSRRISTAIRTGSARTPSIIAVRHALRAEFERLRG
ncbi:LysR family transcriptional regulator [Brevibacterium renqingii]|uniref:LysR family transcriptional regulator n=1 Tax=Brevibacterium renqingii TaxID=2776916 RepID=UPI001ADFBAE8|nr:LysR family transcriptional regulator [Brevibacterium renqingii]